MSETYEDIISLDLEDKADIKKLQQIKHLHLFSEQKLSNTNLLEEYYIRVQIKQIFEQNTNILYESFDESSDDFRDGQEMTLYKKEFEFYVDNDIFQENEILKQNYLEEENIVEIAMLCNEYIPYPSQKEIEEYFHNSDQDIRTIIKNNSKFENFMLFSTALSLENEKVGEKIFDYVLKHYYDLESLLMTLIIAIQWDFKQFTTYNYTVLREFIFYFNGIIDKFNAPEVQYLINSLNDYTLEYEKDIQILRFKTDNYQLKIDPIFFRPCFIQFYKKCQENYIVQNSYKELKVVRFRSEQLDVDDQGTYPHYYELKNEHNDDFLLYAVQPGKHSEINLYTEKDQKAIKYGTHYVGCIERNYWGTQFIQYDFGVDDVQYQNIPKYFAVQRKKILEINYERNITASAPRHFEAEVLQLDSNEIVKMEALKPEYNEKKECYQLNFYGRAKRASARNFEVIPPGDENTIFLLHGKMKKDQFSLDFRHPLTKPQAFAFSLTSISKKFLVS